MKILAVRGKNLASLAGHFEVDFSEPPLDRAGLVAITGPTGAGKTTLLDAMCLALFDRTPRFAKSGGVFIGDEQGGLRANDVRGILRHGAVEGWAEVEFIGVDERRWRARWEVRRARSRAEGRIQAQQMRLLDGVDGSPVAADRKLDVLAAIEARLGLDFDQFRRSVLLAQGEFAAFLEASGGERAELLERMTGTGLYRQLGKAAFERAKLADQDRQLLERERDQLQLLGDEARGELEGRRKALGERRSKLAKQRAEVDGALQWHARDEALTRELAAAQARAKELTGAVEALAEDEALLDRAARVAPLRDQLEARQRQQREIDDKQKDLDWVRGELPLLVEQEAGQKAKVEAAERALALAKERARRLAPELEAAKELDTRIADLADERKQRELKLAEARAEEQRAGRELAEVEGSLATARARAQEREAWLTRHRAVGELAGAWGHYSMLLRQQRADLGERERLAESLAELAPELAEREREQASLEARYQVLRKQRRSARDALRKLKRELDEQPALAELRIRQRSLATARERAEGLRRLLEEYGRARAASVELEAELGEQSKERDARGQRVKAVEAELERVQTGFEEAQRALRQLEAVRDLAGHRVDLRPGEACPLCGATEHPAAEEDAPLDEALAAQRERTQELLRTRDELQRDQGEQVSREQVARNRITRINELERERERERGELQARWVEQLADGPVITKDEAEPELEAKEPGADDQLSLLAGGRASGGGFELPDRIDDAQAETALWAVRDELDRRARTLADIQARVDELLGEQRERQSHSEDCDQRYEELREQLEGLRRERERVSRALEQARERHEELEGELAERRGELLDTVPPALACLEGQDGGGEPAGAEPQATPGAELDRRLAKDGSDLIEALAAACRRHQEVGEGLEAAREGIAALVTRRAELASRAGDRRERREALDAELAQLGERRAELQAAREKLLEGRPVAALTRELEAARELAEADRDGAREALGKLGNTLSAHRTRLEGLEEQLAELRKRAAELDEAAAKLRGELDIDDEALDLLLTSEKLWAGDWAPSRRAAIAEARAALERQRAVVGERERVVAAHREAGRPALDRATAEAKKLELEAGDEELRRELFEVEHRLRSDAEARARAAELEPRLRAAAHEAEIWGRLRDAIGSATGDKFQKFAQSLTLELLLGRANAQLRELKPRYALARVPKHDLELQLIDHDLGDEIRSIRGLSGGEKFLVSLALALGLASLSAEDCRIDSLFIDEGFGTLDAQSLDVAVSTLDALQAEGRQIGVISHVPGLAERVGVEIRVQPVSSGRSTVKVRGPRPAA